MCRSNDFTSTTTHLVLFQSYVRLLRHSLAQPAPWRIFECWDFPYRQGTCFWLGMRTAEICTVLLASVLEQVGRCCVSGQKNIFIQRLALHDLSDVHHVATPALSVCLFALAVILTLDARRFQRTHPLSGMGCSLKVSKHMGLGVIDLSRIANQIQ